MLILWMNKLQPLQIKGIRVVVLEGWQQGCIGNWRREPLYIGTFWGMLGADKRGVVSQNDSCVHCTHCYVIL